MKTRTGIEVYRQADAARRLKVSRQRIGQMIHEGLLDTCQVDGFTVVTASSMVLAAKNVKAAVKVGK